MREGTERVTSREAASGLRAVLPCVRPRTALPEGRARPLKGGSRKGTTVSSMGRLSPSLEQGLGQASAAHPLALRILLSTTTWDRQGGGVIGSLPWGPAWELTWA